MPDAPGLKLTPQSVVATFSGPDGSDAYFWIDQFVVARPDEFDITRSRTHRTRHRSIARPGVETAIHSPYPETASACMVGLACEWWG